MAEGQSRGRPGCLSYRRPWSLNAGSAPLQFPAPLAVPAQTKRIARLADLSDRPTTALRRSLPLEVVDLIGRQCDVQTLARLSATSQAMLEWFGPILLRHIFIVPNTTGTGSTSLEPRIHELFAHRVSEDRPTRRPAATSLTADAVRPTLFPSLQESQLATPIELGLSLHNVRTLEITASLLDRDDCSKDRLSSSRLHPSIHPQPPTIDLTQLTIYLDLKLSRIMTPSPPPLDSAADPIDDSIYWTTFQPSAQVLDLLNPECVRFAHGSKQDGSKRALVKSPPREMHRIDSWAAETIRTKWTRLRTVIMDHVDLITGNPDDLTDFDEDEADGGFVFFMMPDEEDETVTGQTEAGDREWTLRLDVSDYDDDGGEDGQQALAVSEVEERLSLEGRDADLMEDTNVRIVVMVSSEEPKQQFETLLNPASWDSHRHLVTVEVKPALS